MRTSKKAKAWSKANKWFGMLPHATGMLLEEHRKILRSGVKVDSDEYYEKINSFVEKYKTEIAQENMAMELGIWEEWLTQTYGDSANDSK